MPELPEVETVARSLAPLVGRRIVAVATSGKRLRHPVDRRRLGQATVGRRLVAVERIAKYLLFRFDGPDALLAHLGMTGHFLVAAEAEPAPPHTHAVFTLDGAGEELRYVDPRRFGVLRVYQQEELPGCSELVGLGPDPLGDQFTVGALDEALRRTRGQAIKPFLLDQRRVAGLGNIYASEALFVAAIAPRRRADRLRPAEVGRLHGAIREVLTASVARRGTTLRNYLAADGNPGENRAFLAVYERAGEPCLRCGATLEHVVQSGRSTYFCRRCQR